MGSVRRGGRRGPHRRAGVPLVAALAMASLVGPFTGGAASASSTRPAARTPACVVLRPPKGGGAAVLTQAQNGRTYCVRVGEEVLFFLHAPSLSGPMWTVPVARPAGVLQTAALGVLPVRGATARRLRARRAGTATVTATRAVCLPAPGAVACTAMLLFKVILRVLARPGTAAVG